MEDTLTLTLQPVPETQEASQAPSDAGEGTSGECRQGHRHSTGEVGAERIQSSVHILVLPPGQLAFLCACTSRWAGGGSVGGRHGRPKVQQAPVLLWLHTDLAWAATVEGGRI